MQTDHGYGSAFTQCFSIDNAVQATLQMPRKAETFEKQDYSIRICCQPGYFVA